MVGCRLMLIMRFVVCMMLCEVVMCSVCLLCMMFLIL